MRRLPKSTPLTALLVSILLVAGACSSGDESSVAAADADVPAITADADDEGAENESDATDTDTEPSAISATCDELAQPSALYRGTVGWLPQIVDAETEELVAGDYDAVLEAIEILRPIQDIEGIFGTARQGLDNMEADIAAVREGRFDDKVGDYGSATLSAVIGEEVCG